MFNSDKIKKLQIELDELKRDYQILFSYFQDLEWKLDNPPIYNVGEIFGDNIITSLEIRSYHNGDIDVRSKDWYYKTFNQKTKEVEEFYQFQLKK